MGYPSFERDIDWADYYVKRVGLNCTGADVIEALTVDGSRVKEATLVDLLGVTKLQASNLAQSWGARLRKRGVDRSGPNKPAPTVAVASVERISELQEASLMFKRYQSLLDKKASLETSLVNVNAELEKYRPIASVLQTLKTAVHNAKSELEGNGHS